MTPFPGWVSVLSSFVSLFIFYILSYLLSKMMVCFSGCLMSSTSSQKLFCEICSAFKCSFDEFLGEKVVSHPNPPPSWLLPLGDFNTPLTTMDRSTKQKINKQTQTLNDTMDQLDLIDIYRTFHPKTIDFTFFSSAHRTFSRRDHILGHKSSLGNSKN